ncbi:MAG: TetR/AcrR family transcriptional regulator [Polyangiaceae bacterium]|nr:TetR/AcrR family transcriptional regulator [Polyangiaceae bacterium]NUQ75091.1 TetR/AcrR family transcriptional regulator [Polyangiaceae bacterium]
MSKEERRSQLLRAARDVFVSKGFHDAKVDDIVAAAKVAKGTFYLYFPDKRSVFSELVDGLFRRLGDGILFVDTAGDVEAQVKHNIRAIVSVLLDEPALTRVLSYASGLDPEFLGKIRSFYDGVTSLLQQSLEDGQKRGIVAEGDTRLYAKFTIGALKEILLENTMADKPYGREEIVDGLFVFLQRGYLRIEPRPAKADAEAPAAKKPVAKRARRKIAAK